MSRSMPAALCTLLCALAPLAGADAPRPLVLVSHQQDAEVSVLDAATLDEVATIPIANGPTGVAVHPNGRFAAVVNEFGADSGCFGNILIVDIEQGAVVSCVIGGPERMADVAFSPAGDEIFVLRSNSRDVMRLRFDPDDPQPLVVELTPLSSESGRVRRLAVHPDGTRVYVSVAGDNTVEEISVCRPLCSAVTATWSVGARPTGMALSPFGETLYVASVNADSVSMIDTATGERRVLRLFESGAGPRAVAVHPRGDTLYVANTNNASVSIVDLSRPLLPVVTNVAVNATPVDVALHPWASRLVVAHEGSTVLSVIDLATLKVTNDDLARRQYRVAFARFPTTDDVISDPSGNLVDPEVDVRNNRIVWQDLKLSGSEMWVADIDPDTGAISPPDGRGTFIDDGLSPILRTLNGPEWAFGAESTYIVYTDTGAEGEDRIAIAYQSSAPDGPWIVEALPGGESRLSPLGSSAENATDAYVSYLVDEGGGKRLVYRDLDNAPEVEIDVGPTASAAFWAEDAPAFVYSRFGSKADLQINLYDVPSQTARELSSDVGNKYLASFWFAPEFGAELMMCMVGNQAIGIYRQTVDGSWEQIELISLPSIYPFVHSPEPFVYKGRSYVSLVAAEQLGDGSREIASPTGITEIWIASIDAQQPFFRRVSDPTRFATRKDPETYATSAGIVVLYNEQDPGTGRWLLRRAQTGLLFD